MSKGVRLAIFAVVAVAAVVTTTALNAMFATYDTGLHFGGWWFVLPTLVVVALLIRPAWACAFAGLATGGVIDIATDGRVIVSFGASLSAAFVFSAFGLAGTSLAMSVQIIRVFPNAMHELLNKRIRTHP
jgi:hypothetical protein